MMQPIAEYTERSIDGTVKLVLYPDHIECLGSESIGDDFEESVRLKNLDPMFDRYRHRSSLFYTGLWAFMLPTVIALFLVGALGKPFDGEYVWFWWAMGICGLVVMSLAARRRTTVVFRSCRGNEDDEIAITDEGNSRRKFEAFVAGVKLAIEQLKKG